MTGGSPTGRTSPGEADDVEVPAFRRAAALFGLDRKAAESEAGCTPEAVDRA